MIHSLIIAASVLGGTPTSAATASSTEPLPWTEVVAPTAAAVVPGLLLHGAGPWVAGDDETSDELFKLQGLGLALLAGSGVPLALTGASNKLIGPLYVGTLTGISLFGLSALSNIWASVAPALRRGQPGDLLPPGELSLGYFNVEDHALPASHFGSLQGAVRMNRWRTGLRADWAPEAGHGRGTLRVERRLVGRIDGDWWLDGSVAMRAERTHRLHTITPEILVRGRYPLRLWAPGLRGSFAEVAVGMGRQWIDYGSIHDGANLLLFEALWGAYLGDGDGELALYYDHRKDDFAHAFRGTFVVFGHIGARLDLRLSQALGVRTYIEQGGATVIGAQLISYWGKP